MKNQWEYDFGGEPAHAKGSKTSREAAQSLTSIISDLTKTVYEFIVSSGGATCDEIEVGLEMRHQTASSRTWDLERKGYIEESDEKRLTRSGRRARVLVPVRKKQMKLI